MEKEYNPNDDWATLREICVAIVALNQVKNPTFDPQKYSRQELFAYAKNLGMVIYPTGDALFALELCRALRDRGTRLAASFSSPDIVATEIIKVMLSESATADRTMLTFVRDFFADMANLLPANNS